jgi:tetratricopeptide (TPR) repeat protein
MAIEGQLADVSLADIIQLLAVGRKTGCLTVTDRANFGYIYLDDGRVIYANVLNRPDRLGELLVRNGVIDRAELSHAMEHQAREPGRRLGQILVEREALSEEELQRFIIVQIEEAVYHLFTWEQGSFHFDPDARPDDQTGPHVSIHAESLLLEGARRVDEWSMIEKKIPSMDLIFALERRPGDDDEAAVTPEQERLVGLMDGERTVRDLVLETGLVEFDVAKALFGLVQAGYLRQVGRKEAPVAEEAASGGVRERLNVGWAYYRAGMFEEAEREFRAIVKAQPSEAGARGRLAILCLRTGRHDEALQHFEALPPEAQGEPGAVRNRALALELADRHDEAVALLEGLSRERPTDRELLLARAIPLLKSGRPRQAWELLRRYRGGFGAEQVPPPLYYAWAILAAAATGDAEGALRVGREGVAQHPSEGAILVNLGVVLEAREQGAAAEALYLRAVSSQPTPPQAHKNLGDLAYRRGDHAGARAHYERAVRIDPELGDDIYLKLGNLSYREGDRELALQHWRRALELNPRNEVVRTNLQLAASSASR